MNLDKIYALFGVHVFFPKIRFLLKFGHLEGLQSVGKYISMYTTPYWVRVFFCQCQTLFLKTIERWIITNCCTSLHRTRQVKTQHTHFQNLIEKCDFCQFKHFYSTPWRFFIKVLLPLKYRVVLLRWMLSMITYFVHYLDIFNYFKYKVWKKIWSGITRMDIPI